MFVEQTKLKNPSSLLQSILSIGTVKEVSDDKEEWLIGKPISLLRACYHVYCYIKENNLQHVGNPHMFYCNKELMDLQKENKTNQLEYYKIKNLIWLHLD